ncbi:MAG: L-aspartate oxidase [Oscillospiraceae bacterium]|nr:L-aspartate oxidase [Oscillospiraceae bacterium]
MKYAVSRETKIEKTLKYDVVIVGAGLAGLYTALNIDENLSCLIIAKDSIDSSNSWLAQGGIAAAIAGDDTPDFHLEDTVIAGAGLCDMDAVTVLVNEGPSDIEKLVSLNVPFDLDEYGELQFTREGGHNKHRVVHAGGDATGRETVKALSHIVSQRENITFSEHTCLYDVLVGPNGVTGAVVKQQEHEFVLIKTNNVVIATGGIGQVYAASTNPSVATGDGLAAAARAGANLANIEFIQFHPTGLWSGERSGQAFLISEAVRGEGGLLVNNDGVRFMEGVHKLAELAPRDIVARGIVQELKRNGERHAYIDITAKSEEFLKQRFPTIFNECLRRGINIAHDRIPVCPAQHYLMGGIETDLDGRTNIPGLYACGEAAHTGVHGANRLASNSMLECIVFGRRAAEAINNGKLKVGNDVSLPAFPIRPNATLNFSELRREIQQLMSDYCHVVRKKSGLEYALGRVSSMLTELEAVYDDSTEYLETLNIATVACAILQSALNRPQSIGSHYMEEEV